MHLGEGISKRVTLIALNLKLKDNKIGVNGAKYLAEGFAKCGSLISLSLYLR